jgi:hypothetical protein
MWGLASTAIFDGDKSTKGRGRAQEIHHLEACISMYWGGFMTILLTLKKAKEETGKQKTLIACDGTFRQVSTT